MWIVSQHTVHNSPCLFHNLTRYRHERVDESLELDAQQPAFFGTVFFRPASRFRQAQRGPGFQIPRQARHYHVRPVAQQRIDWRVQGVDAALKLLDYVLLLTAAVGTVRREDDIGGFGRPLVGDVEEVTNLIVETKFALLLRDVFADHTWRNSVVQALGR